ncbi:MAG: helix-turn-helix domain-containing protein [Bacillales bacterium]|nr:helix-turn-helix domain-containing protein [Bacillales bacterium]
MEINKKVYLLLKKEDEDFLFYTKKILCPSEFLKIKDNLYYLSFGFEEESYEEVFKNLSIDFFLSIRTVETEIKLPNDLIDDTVSILEGMDEGSYKVEDIIEKAVILGNIKVKTDFKKYYEAKMSKELIETALIYIKSASLMDAAKSLYIHRNTLNYRLETIKKITSLDLKSFKSRFAFYGLFK